MKQGGLSWFEKGRIKYRCRNDFRHNCVCFRDICADIDNNSLQIAGNQPDDNNACIVLVSPFITEEIATLFAIRKKLLSTAMVKVCLKPKKRLSGFCKKRFHEAISVLDSLISETENNCYLETIKLKYDIGNLKAEINKLINNNKPNHAQSKIAECEKKYKEICTIESSAYGEVLTYLNEKVRLIELINARINNVIAHATLRIQYYYGLAFVYAMNSLNEEEKKLKPVLILNNSHFSMICREKLGTEHTGLLTASKIKTLIIQAYIKKLAGEAEKKGQQESDNYSSGNVPNDSSAPNSDEPGSETDKENKSGTEFHDANGDTAAAEGLGIESDEVSEPDSGVVTNDGGVAIVEETADEPTEIDNVRSNDRLKEDLSYSVDEDLTKQMDAENNTNNHKEPDDADGTN
ncbi:MAG: hypothetical protein SPK32_05935 [Bacteroidaceae bacterium]|nr:hypothetical protein [Bacteroidaceae bacterium]